jgi:hypothetical protein
MGQLEMPRNITIPGQYGPIAGQYRLFQEIPSRLRVSLSSAKLLLQGARIVSLIVPLANFPAYLSLGCATSKGVSSGGARPTGYMRSSLKGAGACDGG